MTRGKSVRWRLRNFIYQSWDLRLSRRRGESLRCRSATSPRPSPLRRRPRSEVAQVHRVGVGFLEGEELLPFYSDLAGRQLLPFYAKLWPVTFTILCPTNSLLRRAARDACYTHTEHQATSRWVRLTWRPAGRSFARPPSLATRSARAAARSAAAGRSGSRQSLIVIGLRRRGCECGTRDTQSALHCCPRSGRSSGARQDGSAWSLLPIASAPPRRAQAHT